MPSGEGERISVTSETPWWRRWLTSLAWGIAITVLPLVAGDDLAKMLLDAPGMIAVPIIYIEFNLRDPLSPPVLALLNIVFFGTTIMVWTVLIAIVWRRLERPRQPQDKAPTPQSN